MPHPVHSTHTGGRAGFSQGTSDGATPRLKTDMPCRLRTAVQVWCLLRQVGAVKLNRAHCLTSNRGAAPRKGAPPAGLRPCARPPPPPPMKLRYRQTCLSSTGQRRFVDFVLLFRFKDLLPFSSPKPHSPDPGECSVLKWAFFFF